MFKSLVKLDSEEDKETKRRGLTRSWLKKKEELGYFRNIVRELQLENTEGFKQMMRMDFINMNISKKFQTSLRQILRHKKS